MRTWSLAAPASNTSSVIETVANMVGAIGSDDFSQRVLQQINHLLPVGCWSVYRIGDCTPVLYVSGTYHRKDTTIGSWDAYLSGPCLSDRTLLLGDEDSARPAVAHFTAEEIPSPLHRDKVYRQFDMTERLSVVERQSDTVFALNLYRYNGQRHFSDRELATFELLAPSLLAAVHRHIALQPKRTSANLMSVESIRDAFQSHRPDFPERELEVLARAVMGMSYEGIAADLGLKLPTVKTYRNRAFERLGIHFRSELVRYYLGIAEAR